MKLGSSIHSGSSTSSSPERDPGTKRESAFGRLRRKLSPRRSSSSSADRGAAPAVENAPASVDCGKSGELRRVFDYFDKNGDGRISPAELRSCVRSLGGDLSSEEAEMAVRSSDLDGDGMLGFERLMESGGEEERRKDLEEAFGTYEMEGSGCITASILRRTLGPLGEARSMEDCKTMIRAVDLNGDGDGEARNMADQTVTPQRNDGQLSRQQQQQESFGSTKRFHIIFTSFKLLVITHFNSQPTEALSHLILQLYIICEATYLIALIQVTGPTSPNPIYKYLYIIFGTLGAELLLWTSLSLAMWLILNMCLFVFALTSAGLLTQVSNQLLEIVLSSNDVLSGDVPSVESFD